jgi:hypothetical protein
MPVCPICKKAVTPLDDPVAPNQFFPFCGERCKLIDLGRWLSEKYGVPISRSPRPAEPPVEPDQRPQ